MSWLRLPSGLTVFTVALTASLLGACFDSSSRLEVDATPARDTLPASLEDSPSNGDPSQTQMPDAAGKLANPADGKCVQDGHRVEPIYRNGLPVESYCVDERTGTKCESWSYYRGECGFSGVPAAPTSKELPIRNGGVSNVPWNFPTRCAGTSTCRELSSVPTVRGQDALAPTFVRGFSFGLRVFRLRLESALDSISWK